MDNLSNLTLELSLYNNYIFYFGRFIYFNYFIF